LVVVQTPRGVELLGRAVGRTEVVVGLGLSGILNPLLLNLDPLRIINMPGLFHYFLLLFLFSSKRIPHRLLILLQKVLRLLPLLLHLPHHDRVFYPAAAACFEGVCSGNDVMRFFEKGLCFGESLLFSCFEDFDFGGIYA